MNRSKQYSRHLCKAFDEMYQTNCYIVQTPQGELIIDPGIKSQEWVLQNVKNPLAILVTHGHFDHIYALAHLRKMIPNLPIYCPKNDAFMLESDCFDTGLIPCAPDVLVDCEKSRSDFNIKGVEFSYFHFPGHTPGCSIILIDDRIYSGDFIFKRSIGRYDFPYSSAQDMKESLQRFIELEIPNFEIFPGHGDSTCVEYEKNNIALWAQRI